ncbi:MAG: c-type cytochrome [Minwuia sp.]|uniref:c-type cytochrome n=1 Tax=Minwuia sp. TaxID=2493630 RepID=UPI003A889862
MNRLLKLALPLALLAATASTALADKAAENAIKARKAQMQLYAFNLGSLGAMAKGDAPYEAEAASALAANMNALANLKTMTMWPQGSDSTAMPDMTRAKAEAWTTWPAIGEKQKDLETAVAELIKVAGNGQAALGEGLKAVGGACGGCHKAYRDENK